MNWRRILDITNLTMSLASRLKFEPAAFGFHSVIPIHTTDLAGNKIISLSRRVSNHRHIVKGPAVLVPRVGQPNVAKIALYLEPSDIALSDCVFALTCRSQATARRLETEMRSRFDEVVTAYGGSGAQFLTLNSLVRLLQGWGYESNDWKAHRSLFEVHKYD